MKREIENLFRRVLTLFMSLMVLLSSLTVVPFIAGAQELDETVTYPVLVSEKYPGLNEGERGVLVSGELLAGSFTYRKPTADDADSLISVDPDLKTVTVLHYTDAYGNDWKPSVVEVVYDGGRETVKLNADGKGAFTYSGNSYNISVNYSLDKIIPVDVQRSYLNAAADLSEGLNSIKGISDQIETIRSLQDDYIDQLKQLADGVLVNGIKIGPTDQNFIQTINTLYAQKQENGGKFNIVSLIESYFAASSKSKILFENGEQLRLAAVEMEDYLSKIGSYDATVRAYANIFEQFKIPTRLAEIIFEDLKNTALALQNYMGNPRQDELGNTVYDTWNILAGNPFRTPVNYTKLDELAPILSEIGSNVVLTEDFHIADTEIAYNMNRFNITVKLTATVIDTVTNKPATLTYKNVVIPLDSGSAKEKVLSAITDSLAEKNALNEWNGKNALYKINTDNYIRTMSVLPAALLEDITVDISYVPKQISIVAGGIDLPSSVEYGKIISLPLCPEEDKVYDYTVNGIAYDEGISIRVTSPLTITRALGASWNYITLNSAAADALGAGAPANILKAEALKSDTIRLRKPMGNIVSVVFDAGSSSYIVTAETYQSGLAGAVWVPVSVNAVSAAGDVVSTAAITNQGGQYKGSFAATEFDHVEVDYQLNVTNAIDNQKFLKAINLPHILVNEATKQQSDINIVDKVYGSLGSVNGNASMLRVAINGAYDDDGKDLLTTSIRNAGLDMVNRCFNKETGNLFIYEYLTAYHADGLAWLYHQTADGTFDNFEAVNNQLNILKEDLPVICDEENVFKDYLDDFEFNGETVGKYYDDLKRIVESVEQTELLPPNESIDGTKSDVLKVLVNAINAGKGKTQSYTSTEGINLILHETMSANAPDRSGVIINVTILNNKNKVIGTYSKSKSYAITDVLGASDISELNGMLADILNNVDTKHYVKDESVSNSLPAEGTAMNTDKIVNITYIPKVYTVTFKGKNFTAEFPATTFKFGDNTVVLPACNEDNARFDFSIGANETISTSETASQYIFSNSLIDVLFVNDTYEITVNKVDLELEQVLLHVDNTNKKMGDYKMTYAGKTSQNYSLIPYTNEAGEVCFVYRLSISRSFKTQDVLASLAESIVNTNFDKIGIGGRTIFDSTAAKVSVPAIVSTILYSGLRISQIPGMITKAGDIIEMGNPNGLVCIKDIDEEGGYWCGSNYIPEAANTFGALLFKSTLDLGDKSYDIYFTLEDFDKDAKDLKDLRDAADTILEYVDIKTENGRIGIDANLPDEIYGAYLAGLSLTGNASLRDINNVDLANALKYIYNMIIPTLCDNGVTYDTLENTKNIVDKGIDISMLKGVFSLVQSLLREITNNSTVAKDKLGNDLYSSVGATLNADYDFNTNTLIDTVLVDGDTTSLKRFVETGIVTYGLDVHLQNAETEYDALVIDTGASGISNIVKAFKAGETQWTKKLSGGKSVIILLSDTANDIVTDKEVYVDLNGYKLNGSIRGKNITLVDSTLNNTGSVTGEIDVLRDARENTFYHFEEDGNKVRVVLNSSLLKSENIKDLTDLTTVGTDILFDILLNYYTTASLKIGNNDIYSINIEDILTLYKSINDAKIDELLQMIDCAGITGFANEFIDALTDFGAVANQIEKNKPIYSATIDIGKWNVETSHNTGKNTIDIGINARHCDPQTFEIVAGGTAEEKTNAVRLFRILYNVLKVDADVSLNSLHFNNKNVEASADARLELNFDFTDPVYSIALSTIVAEYSNAATKAAVVSAVKAYYASASLSALKSVFDNLTYDQLINAAKKFGQNVKYEDIVADLGLTGVIKPNVISRVDDVRVILDVACKAVREADVKGNSKTLGSFVTENEIYVFYDEDNVNRSDRIKVYDQFGLSYNFTADKIKITMKLFSKNEDYSAVIVKDNDITIYTGNSFEEALKIATDNCEIYIRDNIVMEKDVTANYVVKVIGTDFIDFNGKVISIGEDGAITFDKAISPENFVSSSPRRELVFKDDYTVVLTQLYDVVTLNGDAVVYGGYSLSEAFSAALEGYTVAVQNDVSMTADIDIGVSVSLLGGAKITFGEYAFNLKAGGSLISDIALTVDVQVVTDEAFRAVNESGTTYSLVVLDPEWNGNDPAVKAISGVSYKGIVDAAKNYIILDVASSGITEGELNSILDFSGTADNSSGIYNITLAEDATNVKNERTIIKNGAEIKVTTSNPASLVIIEKEFTLIILGDANKDGVSDSKDCRLLQMHILGETDLVAGSVAYIAGDINCSKSTLAKDDIDSKDCRKIQSKLLNPNMYVSSLR